MFTLEQLNALGAGTYPGLLGVEVVEITPDGLHTQLAVRPDLLAPNGFLHAGAVVGLADTTCGYGTFLHLPAGAENFTTVELKSNFLGTARAGVIRCEARLVHGGRTTQVWDAQVLHAPTGKVIALFRCTQFLLYPRSADPSRQGPHPA